MLKYGERMNVHTDRRALAALALLVSAAPAAAQGSFHRLGGISGIGDGSSTAYAVSADGTTVVGGGGSSEPGTSKRPRLRLRHRHTTGTTTRRRRSPPNHG